MFYATAHGNHGLPHDPLKALVAPRPIGWISSLAPDGTANLAPYSFFNLVAAPPPVIAFSSYSAKDSQRNIEAGSDFVCNIATSALRYAVNESSAPVGPDIDEFALAGVSKVPAELVQAPRVAEAPAHLECTYMQSVALPGPEGTAQGWTVIFGRVVGVHIDDSLIDARGRVDIHKLAPLSRLGYLDYGVLGEVFELPRP